MRINNIICIFAVGESCMDILRNNPNMKGKDGVYSLNVGGQIKPAFCDMTTDTGGWTVSIEKSTTYTLLL
jgi:hypothetical protein